MKKIKTLFKRVIVDHKIIDILPEYTEGCEWVLTEACIPTRKVDGEACAIIDGKLYARLDFKNLKSGILPEGAIPCQDAPDPITGSFPYWVPAMKDGVTVLTSNIDVSMAIDKNRKVLVWGLIDLIQSTHPTELHQLDGTYELCGPKVQNNAEHLEKQTLIRHGSIILEDFTDFTFEGIKHYLETHFIEGIVFYRSNGDMAKIKRSDFGLSWKTDNRSKSLKYSKKKMLMGTTI